MTGVRSVGDENIALYIGGLRRTIDGLQKPFEESADGFFWGGLIITKIVAVKSRASTIERKPIGETLRRSDERSRDLEPGQRSEVDGDARSLTCS